MKTNCSNPHCPVCCELTGNVDSPVALSGGGIYVLAIDSVIHYVGQTHSFKIRKEQHKKKKPDYTFIPIHSWRDVTWERCILEARYQKKFLNHIAQNYHDFIAMGKSLLKDGVQP